MRPICAAVDCAWTPDGRGDRERERWMAFSVVFCLLSMRALPSASGETTPVSARLVCHIETFFNQTLCKLYMTPRLQTPSPNVWQEDFSSDRACLYVVDSQSIKKKKVKQSETSLRSVLRLTHPTALHTETNDGQRQVKSTFTCKLSAIWRMYIMLRSSNIHSFSSMFANLSTGILQAEIHKTTSCFLEFVNSNR